VSKSDSVWYPRYPGDYQRKTAHLSLLEHGCYTVLLDHYYSTGKPLPANADVLQRVCRAFAEAEISAMRSVLDQFFTFRNNGYHNDRADDELLKRSEIRIKRQSAAANRHAKDEQNASKTACKTDALADTSTSTSTVVREEERTSIDVPKKKVVHPDFAEWWSVYPNRVGKGQAETAYRSARAIATQAELIEGVRRYIRDKPADRQWKNPATWLNGRCWEDQPATVDMFSSSNQSRRTDPRTDW
jgi:uncharacterized protein YdaU (DUF1376 family)